MTEVRGKDVNLYVYNGLVPKFTACATSLSLDVESEDVEITTADSGKEREYEGGFTDASIGFEGVVTLDEISRWQYDDFVDNIGTKIRVLVKFTNRFGDVLAYDMQALIKTVGARADATDFSFFSLSLKRSGAMTKLKTFNGLLLDSNGDPILDSDGNYIRA